MDLAIGDEPIPAAPTQRDLISPHRELRLRFPTRIRDVFGLLAAFPDPDQLAAALDMSGVTPRDIYNTVLARPPESIEHARARPGYDAARHFHSAIHSREFQDKIIRQFLSAFSELRREVFIHIPKCAGTDLILNVGGGTLTLPIMLRDPAWVASDDFVRIVSSLAREANFSDFVFVYGHIQLGEYLDIAGMRSDDRVFTILRDPADLLLSQANYAIGRLRQDPTGAAPDTAAILESLELARFPEEMSASEVKSLTARALLNPRISQPNRISYFLGSNQEANFRQALVNIIANNVEVTTTDCYQSWLKDRWRLDSATRHNRSETLLHPREVSDVFADEIRAATSEDQKLFDVITWCMERKGGNCIFGSEIADMIDGIPFGKLPEFVGRHHVRSLCGTPEPIASPFLVEGTDEVGLYLADIADADLKRRSPELLKRTFKIDGDGLGALREGWALPEPRHVWTSGKLASVVLPTPIETPSVILRIMGAPFVADERLPRQRIAATVNGVALGETEIRELAVIEWRVPGSAIATGGEMRIEIATPDAEKASDVRAVDDHRVLGFALREITLLRAPASIETEAAPIDPPVQTDAAATAAAPAPEMKAETSPAAATAEITAPEPVAAETVIDEVVADEIAPTEIVEPPALIAEMAAAPDPRPADAPPQLRVARPVPPLHELMLSFENLGENCEFGLVQRQCGAEPLGLLRFGSSPLPVLLAALDARFEGMGRADRLEVQVSDNGTEYMVKDRTFGFLYHAWVLTKDQSAEAVHAREVRRVPFLIRKLVEDISGGEKLLVYHGMRPLGDDEINRLVASIGSYGNGTVLWVEMCDAAHPPSHVERLGPSLIKGYVDRFAPGENAHDISIDCWITLCQNAYSVWKEG